MMKKYTFLTLVIGLCLSLSAQTPASEQSKRIMLYGATAHLGNGDVIEHSLVILEEGKILTVEDATNIRIDISNAEYYDVIGKHVYPGFILPNSTLGLADIDAVRATRDFDEVGAFNPHVRSIIAYNTDSPIIPTVRTNGVLMAQITPRGGLISGSSSVVEFDAWNWEDALYKENDAIHMNWPKTPWPYSKTEHPEVHKAFKKNLKKLHSFFEESKAYAAHEHSKTDQILEAMRGLFDGSKSLFINVRRAKEIQEAVLFAQEMQVKNIVVVGAEDSWRLADFLAENNVSVILNRVHSLPIRAAEDVDIAYKKAKILYDAGVLYCLNYDGDMERMGSRNLPFTAGTTAAYGLTKEEALMSITLNPAKILGIDKTVGSLEAGKDATLFVSEGDALDMMGNNISLAFIRGKKLDLTNPQTELYEKYKKRYQKIANN